MKKLTVLTVFGAMVLAVGVTRTEASELNLTGGSSTGTGTTCVGDAANPCTLSGGLWSFAGLLWETNIEQPTGSGYIDSFLRVEGTSAAKSMVVDGMNTSGALLNDEKSGFVGGANFTHDVLISDLAAVTVDGTEYYKFLLDINQEGGDPLLTLSGLQFCQSTSASVSFADTCAGSDTANPGQGTSVLKYDMQFPTALPATCTDADQTNNDACTYDGNDASQPGLPNRVLMDYNLNSGSGSGDVFVYVPTALLPESDGAYLYLWSQFGAPVNCAIPDSSDGCATNNDGYEEWAFLGEGESQIPGGEVPEPGSLVLLGTGLLFGGHLIRRRSRKQRAAKTE